MSHDGISITHRLDPHEWSNEETAAYEAAMEAVNGAVAAEEANSAPDGAVIEAAVAAQTRLARERESLHSSDHEQIAAARAHYARLAHDVMAGLA